MGITYGICSYNDIVARLNSLKQQWKKLLFALISFLSLVSIQLIYWKLITGSFFIYSYDKGTFNFTNPEIKNVLFSVRKGLFFWTPVLITIIPGISYIRRKAGYYFFPILIYFPLSIYIISSWSYWWYGGSFGQRPFVESTPVFSIALCSLYEGISKTGKQILVAFMLTSCLYTTWLMLKYWLGIIHYDETTWEYFRSTFFKIQFP